METYALYPQYQKACQPYKCPVPGGYPNPKMCYHQQSKDVALPESECRPFGYQPKRPNPGGLKFYMYDYPFQTQGGKPLSHPGKGWYEYENTGEYYR
uniref:Uncharacterized protein n=1 Tax=Marseillevirus LCMAC102 TaxID=2506603 RepID=A0A481YUZ2_9VIRU|nr:MAG: hypothetical protein LCMAC102_04110 [Marseillevirus LCMAC102]